MPSLEAATSGEHTHTAQHTASHHKHRLGCCVPHKQEGWKPQGCLLCVVRPHMPTQLLLVLVLGRWWA